MDVSPKQLVSVAAALIPFLENDDANRALMGSNMQRQAVPLIKRGSAARRHRHGRRRGAATSGAAIAARRTGIIDQVDATRIVVRATEELDPGKSGRRHLSAAQVPALEPEHLHQPASAGERRRSGDEGRHHRRRSFDRSRRAGARPQRARRVHAVERATTSRTRSCCPSAIVKDDVFTSIHIEEFEVMARDTKLGPEEITRDIPNVSEEALKNLDEAGIVYIGAEVHAGRHPGRQDHAEGRKPDDAGRKASARDLRREGLGRARHLAAGAAGRLRARSSRCGCSTATASRRTSARWRSSARRSSASPRTATTSRRSLIATSMAVSPTARRASRHRRAEGLQEGHQDQPRGARRVSALAVVAVRLAQRQADGRDRGHAQAVRRLQEGPRAALPRQGREAAARRRAAAGRDEDGQGLRRREAQDPAGRQDGRPPRQQGRGVADRAAGGHAVPG